MGLIRNNVQKKAKVLQLLYYRTPSPYVAAIKIKSLLDPLTTIVNAEEIMSNNCFEPNCGHYAYNYNLFTESVM